MCLVPMLLGICIADPANLSLQAGASEQLAGDFQYWCGKRNYGGGLVGIAKIDMAVPLSKRLTLHYGVEHTSLLNTRSDRGQERFAVSIEWRPFGERK